MNRRSGGFTFLHLAVFLALASMASLTLAKQFALHARKANANRINDQALTVLRAMDGYYGLKCNLFPFPQPNLSTMEAEGVISNFNFENPWGSSLIQLDIENPKSLRSQLTVTINFTRSGDASYVSGLSRNSTQIGSSVKWSTPPSLLQRSDMASAIDDISLFSNQPCLGL